MPHRYIKSNVLVFCTIKAVAIICPVMRVLYIIKYDSMSRVMIRLFKKHHILIYNRG